MEVYDFAQGADGILLAVRSLTAVIFESLLVDPVDCLQSLLVGGCEILYRGSLCKCTKPVDAILSYILIVGTTCIQYFD